MKPPKISLIIPIYNVQACLSASLNSAIHQTLFDIEIICVNDGSTDNSLTIVKEFAKIDQRIIVIDKPNGGLSSARNAGLKASSGEIVMFLDSDDILCSNACERVWLEYLERAPEIIVFSTEIFPEKPRAEVWYYNVLTVTDEVFENQSFEALMKKKGGTPFVWRQAYLRELIVNNKIRFDESIRFGEDTIFQFEIFPYAKRISFVSDKLYKYRWYREGSLMGNTRGNNEIKYDEHLKIIRTILEYWQSRNWLEKHGSSFFDWALILFKIRGYTLTKSQITETKKLLEEYNYRKYLKKIGTRLEYRKLIS